MRVREFLVVNIQRRCTYQNKAMDLTRMVLHIGCTHSGRNERTQTRFRTSKHIFAFVSLPLSFVCSTLHTTSSRVKFTSTHLQEESLVTWVILKKLQKLMGCRTKLPKGSGTGIPRGQHQGWLPEYCIPYPTIPTDPCDASVASWCRYFFLHHARTPIPCMCAD